jgi:hypothetical protein
MRRRFVLAFVIAAFTAPLPAHATSTFARQYGFSCERCHTIVPALNTFGQNFKTNGYRVAGKAVAHTVPLSTSILTTYESRDGDSHARTSVDEWRVQSGGALGPALTYYIEQYVLDGGAPGSLDQAWVQYDSNTAHPIAKTDVRVRAGRLYLPLPVYADTYRPTLNPYGIFEQTVGDNSFSLGDEYNALDVAIGSDYDRASIHAFASSSTAGLFAHQNVGAVTLSAYRIAGRSGVDNATDAFWRQGLVAAVQSKTLKWTNALQNGYDSNPVRTATGEWSSGGFSELQLSVRGGMMAVERFDATFGGGAAERSLTSTLMFRLTENSRLTLEDVLHDGSHHLQTGLLLGF